MNGYGDTIFALSSGAPPAGIAVVRISGPRAHAALERLAGIAIDERRASLVTVKSETGAVLDRALALRFAAPATATGEDVAELHLHGGRAIVAAVLACLDRMPGLRAAVPGEFTRRAFENGRIDLIEAEGLADLLAAETESQRRQAMALAGGTLSSVVHGWQDGLLRIAARVEAEIDFSDEDDVGPIALAEVRRDIADLADTLDGWLRRPPAERLRDGVSAVIAGPPNAGKSTLLNAIVQREAAITSPQAGTTRDIVEAAVSLGGVPFVFADTAGLRDGSDDAIETIGIARAEAAARAADILVWLDDACAPDHRCVVRVAPQADRRSGAAWTAQAEAADVVVSAVTGRGIDALIALLVDRARALLPLEGEVALNRRQRAAIAAMHAALTAAADHDDIVLVAEDLRVAMAALDALTGQARTEDMLDALFGRFCIGK